MKSADFCWHWVGHRQHDREALYLMCVETVAAQLPTPQAVCLPVE